MNRRFDVVTGGAGFIGSHLCEALLQGGREVRVVDDFSSGKWENLEGLLEEYPGQLEVFEMDIRDLEELKRVVDGADCLFHEAAMTSVEESIRRPDLVNAVNVDGTLSVLTAARDGRVRKLVFASSTAVYGNSPALPKQEGMMPEPASPYAVTKTCAEMYCRMFSELFGLQTVCLRYFNVFGPRQDPGSPYAAVIPKFSDRVLRGQAPLVFGDGEQTRDFVFVKDVVRANLLATDSGASGEVFNVASGKSHSLNQLLGLVQRLLQKDVAPLHQPPRAGEVRHSSADIRKAKEVMGFVPEVSLEAGLAQTLSWYRDRVLQ